MLHYTEDDLYTGHRLAPRGGADWSSPASFRSGPGSAVGSGAWSGAGSTSPQYEYPYPVQRSPSHRHHATEDTWQPNESSFVMPARRHGRGPEEGAASSLLGGVVRVARSVPRGQPGVARGDDLALHTLEMRQTAIEQKARSIGDAVQRLAQALAERPAVQSTIKEDKPPPHHRLALTALVSPTLPERTPTQHSWQPAATSRVYTQRTPPRERVVHARSPGVPLPQFGGGSPPVPVRGGGGGGGDGGSNADRLLRSVPAIMEADTDKLAYVKRLTFGEPEKGSRRSCSMTSDRGGMTRLCAGKGGGGVEEMNAEATRHLRSPHPPCEPGPATGLPTPLPP